MKKLSNERLKNRLLGSFILFVNDYTFLNKGTSTLYNKSILAHTTKNKIRKWIINDISTTTLVVKKRAAKNER